MPSVLFEARLTNAPLSGVISFSCILFGADSVEQKEQLFRAICQSKYPYWQIHEPLTIRITVLLNPQLEPYFIQIAHYSTYQLNNYMGLKSWYSMRFFEILSAFRDTGVWCPTVEQYRQLMDCSEEKDKRGKVKRNKEGNPKMKYPDTRDLIRFTMTEPLEELASTNLAFSYEPVYETDRMTRGRKKITGFKFVLKRKQDGKIPEYWLQNTIVSKVVAGLREWKVTDRNIALYFEDVGTKEANKGVSCTTGTKVSSTCSN